jgi:alkylation response protein AidB-like acyl-CoA dehydrogenase
MRFGASADQRALAAAVREVLTAHCPPKLVRAAAEDPAARRGELWRHLGDLGLFGLLAGDLGLTEVDAVLVFEELGRAAAPGPLLETAFVAPGLLAGVPPLADRWLTPLAAGEVAVSLSLLPGQYAVDADLADLTVVVNGDAVHVGGGLIAQPGVDAARRLFSVARGPIVAAGPEVGRLLAAARCRGSLGTAAFSLGAAEHLLETTVAYARQRQQFGQAIGGFQAVKHQLTDVLLALEFARPLVHRAAWTLSHDEPGAPRDVSAAAAAAIDAADLAARVALQVHGAIGYTAELDLHLWLRRVWSLRAAWGSAAWHRARVADALLGPG